MSKSEIKEKIEKINLVFKEEPDYLGCEYKAETFYVYVKTRETYNEIAEECSKYDIEVICSSIFRLLTRR